MILEFCYYNIENNDRQVKDIIKQASTYLPHSISLLPDYIKLTKNIISKNTKISAIIDYPLGVSSINSRINYTNEVIKLKPDILEVVCPAHILCNKKYSKFREDISILNDIAKNNNIELRYILEYRFFTFDLMCKASGILFDAGVDTIYPSTGYSLDNIHDNILASAWINKKVPKIKIINTCNFWNTNHTELIKKSDIYGIKVNSINALDIISKNIEKSI